MRGRRVMAMVRRVLRAAYKQAEAHPSLFGPLLRLPPVERARERLNAGSLSANDVVDVLALLERSGVRAWLIGGWAVDALLGEQTRAHDDLDLVVETSTLEAARAALERAGFRPLSEAPIDTHGRLAPFLTLHVKMIDGLRRPVALHPADVEAWSAPAGLLSMARCARELEMDDIDEVFTAGRLAGDEVPSLGAAAQMVLRCGYEIRDRDRLDVRALSSRFGLRTPRPYLDAGHPSDPAGVGPTPGSDV